MANGTTLQALAITGISYLLFFASALPAVPATRTVVLFDRSASMLQPHQGSRKIDLAKQLFANMSSQFTQDPNLSVRFFAGGTSADPTLDCSASKIGLAPAPNRGASEFTALLDQVNAVGHQTPITYALGLAQADMATWSGPRKIILISDGQETCEQDPEALAESLSQAGITVDTIGIGAPGKFAQLGMIALGGGGEFHLAENLAALQSAIQKAAGGSSHQPLEALPATPPTMPAINSSADPANLPQSSGGASGLLIALPTAAKLKLPQQQAPGDTPALAVEIIFDASGSMAARLQGETKLSLARAALKAAVPDLEHRSIVVGLRAYGFDQQLEKTPAASCPNTELVLPFINTDQAAAIIGAASKLTAYGYTPIANSLALAGQDLLAIKAQKSMIILISDGEETCGGDPAAVAALLRAQGIDLQTHVVGFNLDAAAQQQMQAIATAGGGQYFDAADGDDLGASLVRVIDLAEAAADPWDMRLLQPVKGGVSPAEATPLNPGSYTLDAHLPKGQQRYFKVATSIAQRALLRGVIQSRKAMLSSTGEATESTVARAGFEIRLFRPDGSEVKGHWARVYGERGEQAHTAYMDLTGEGFVFSVGNRYDTVNKDALFNLNIAEAGDIQPGQDAPAGVEQALALTLDQTSVGHLGLADRIDTYQLILNAPGSDLRLRLQFTEPAFRFQVDIKDGATGKRIKRFTRQTGASDVTIAVDAATTDITIQLKDNNPGLDAVFSSYTLELNQR